MLPKPQPVGLVGIVRHELDEGVPELAAVRLEPGCQSRVARAVAERRRDRLHEAEGHGLKPAEDVIGADRGRLAGGRRRDPGVPVAIGAYP